jgi:hypothetical protein
VSHPETGVDFCKTKVPIRVKVIMKNTLAYVTSEEQSQFIEDSKHEMAKMVENIRDYIAGECYPSMNESCYTKYKRGENLRALP